MVRLNPRSFRVLNKDGASDMMHPVEGSDHVGAFLREARETTGWTVIDVAENLRIRRVYLEAIEDGRFDELPGATYAVGFVRSYAAYLRLDTPTLVARFKEEASGIEAPQELEFPMPVPEGRFPGGLLVTVCLVLGAAVFGGWYWYQSQNSIEVVRVPAPPGDVQANTEVKTPPQPGPSAPAVVTSVDPSIVTTAGTNAGASEAPKSAPEPAASEPAARAITAAVPTISEPDDSAPVAVEPGVPLVPPSYLQPQGDPLASMVDVPTLAEAAATADAPPAEVTPAAATSVEEPAAVTEVAVATPAPAPAEFSSEPAIIALPEIVETEATSDVVLPDREGRVYGARNAAARIILRAQENTWVQVRDGEESVVLTQILQAGDRYLVPNRDGLRLMTGNAGALDISVDGDLVPAIGERGESRRDVRLDPNLLKAGAAVVR